MSLFKTLISTPTPSVPKGIVYGPAGCGKTTFGGTAQDSIIIDCENGAGTIPCRRTPYLQTWPEIAAWLKALETEQHPYRVVVIDTLDWMLRRIEENVSGSSTKLDSTLQKSHGGYGNGKLVMKNHVYQHVLPQLDRIVTKGIAVILLAHASRTQITDADGITTEKTAPDLPTEYLNVFVEWSDFVCMARVEGGDRTMVTTETQRALAKNRYSLPPKIPFTYRAFSEAITAGLAYQFGTTKQENANG